MRNSGVIGDAADCGVIPTLIPAQSRTASRLLYKSPDGNPKQAGLGVHPRIPGLPFGVRRVLPLAFGRVHPDARDPATVPHDPEPRNCQRPPCRPEPTIPPESTRLAHWQSRPRVKPESSSPVLQEARQKAGARTGKCINSAQVPANGSSAGVHFRA